MNRFILYLLQTAATPLEFELAKRIAMEGYDEVTMRVLLTVRGR